MDDYTLFDFMTIADELEDFWALYFSKSVSRKRFMVMSNKLPKVEQQILYLALAGNLSWDEPAAREYLSENQDAIDRFFEVFSEIEDQLKQSENLSIQRLLVLLTGLDSDTEASYLRCEYLRHNPHLSPELLREWVEMAGVRTIEGWTGPGSGVHIHENMPGDLVAEFGKRKEPALLKHVARHRNCPTETLLTLMNEKRWKVRQHVPPAPNITDGMLLKLLADEREEVAKAVSKAKDPAPIVLEGLLHHDIRMTAKQIKELLKQRPDYAWAEPGEENRSHQKLLSAKQKVAGEVDPKLLRADYQARAAAAIKGLESDLHEDAGKAESETVSLDDWYAKSPEDWGQIITNGNCSEKLIRKIFIDHGDVNANPKVQERMHSDMHYQSRLLPRSKKERLKVAAQTPFLSVLRAIFCREYFKDKAKIDADVLAAVAQNPMANLDLLSRLYAKLGVKEVSLHPECTTELRRAVLSDAEFQVDMLDETFCHWFY